MANMSVQTTFSDAPAIGYAGMLDSNLAHDVVTMLNAEASASIAFGKGVVFKGTPTTAKDAVLPAAETDVPVGIVVFSQTYALDNGTGDATGLDANGVTAGQFLNVLRRGRILVIAEDGCEIGDKLWIRCTAGGDGEVVGGLTNADEGTETIDATAKGTWMSNAAAGELAWLDVNF